MTETEFSRLLDQILEGELGKLNAEAVLVAASGALLLDEHRIQSFCTGDRKYKALAEAWSSLCRRVLKGYDKVAAYFLIGDPEILEQAFELVSSGMSELRELTPHLPPSIAPAHLDHNLSLLDDELESTYTVFLEKLETLSGRRSLGALREQVSHYKRVMARDDRVLLEDLDCFHSRRYYKFLSEQMLAELDRLLAAESLEQREQVLLTLEKLTTQRLSFQESLA